MCNPISLARKNIRDLKPYSSARDEYSGKSGVFLDANENAFGSVSEMRLNRYPDPRQQQLKEKLAAVKGIDPEQIFLGNGSDEPIDLLIRAFCEPREESIMILPPTYGMYSVCANINDVGILEVPLTDEYDLDLPEIEQHLSPAVKLIFLCSPNNPTGNSLSQKAINALLESFQGIVVLDEAYIDFAPDKSWLPQLSEHANLVILQTFSKAWGMANLRLGMAFANPEMIQILNKIKYPYNLNGVTQEIALKALDNLQKRDQMVAQILQERETLRQQLCQISFVEKIHESDANFLLVKMKNARSIYEKLLEKLIIVRDRSSVLLCDDCLRITVGTPEENQTLIKMMQAL